MSHHTSRIVLMGPGAGADQGSHETLEVPQFSSK